MCKKQFYFRGIYEHLTDADDDEMMMMIIQLEEIT